MIQIQKKIRVLLVLFITGMVLSGITAFPIQWEISLLQGHTALIPQGLRTMYEHVSEGVFQTNQHYPFLAYGTDWLAFSHLVIALFFLPVLKHPVQYIANIEMGIVACIGVFLLAFCCGPIRGIPFLWQLVDCSFGVGGGLLLVVIRRNILLLKTISTNTPAS
jgi:hypothetical protein